LSPAKPSVVALLVLALALSHLTLAKARAADDLECFRCVDTRDIANRAVVRSKIKNGAISGNKLSDKVAFAIQPGVVILPAAAFRASRADSTKFFFDLNGYIIPSNGVNDFCAQAKADLPLGVTVVTFDTYYLLSSIPGKVTVKLKSSKLQAGHAPSDATEHGTADITAFHPDIQVFSYDLRESNLGDASFQVEDRHSYWIEVCIEADGINARNTRVYAVEVGYVGTL